MNTTLEKNVVLPDVSRLSFDAKKHAYTLDGTKLLTGVTSVIDGTSSKANLIGWAANMAVDYIKENSPEDVRGGYMEDGSPVEDSLGFVVSHETLEEARTAYAKKRDKAADNGTSTHAIVETFINVCLAHGGRPQLNVELLHSWKPTELITIRPFMDWSIANVDRFLAAEQRLYSEKHMVGGTCDFIAIIDGKLTIGDLKTFPKMWSADAFIQCGAYSLMFKELTGQQPVQSVIVKMCDPQDERIKKYGNKPFAVYPRYALAEDEEMFLTRLGMYRYNKAFVSPKE